MHHGLMDPTRSALEGVEHPPNVLPVPPGDHRDVDHPIPVRVRIEWTSGPEWVPGLALEWTRDLVRVATREQRLHPRVVWVRAGDVRRA